MKRDIYKRLLEWKDNSLRKPLILKGARQTGKTYLLREFGQKEFESVAYFNFEEEPALKGLFADSLNPEKILEKLSIYSEKNIKPNKTLIFFDEIQESPRTLTSLKYFSELSQKYHIVSAGSLLGIQIEGGSSFPVGKVSFLDLYPFSFGEFLSGLGKKKLRGLLETVSELKPVEDIFHQELIEDLKLYFYVGGMPEAIKRYNAGKDLKKVREVHEEILQGYLDDFGKHTSKPEAIKLVNTWQAIPVQLAKENKKFKYSEISKYARAREYNNIITWLESAGLVYKSYQIEVPKLPLGGYRKENIFKLFLLDVGLLGAMLKLSPKSIIEGNALFSEYNGAYTENFVAQELIASGFRDLYYWASKATAEVDFLVLYEDKIYPLEVKAGTGRRKKSLKIYGRFYDSVLSMATARNFKQDGEIHNYPLYAVKKFPGLSRT
ncbi:MAG: AAA family ATPase [Candidatus Omnitrophica bacterium]|nr:AAA family ATPase [Candidatus Omnitrophota bacterium]